MFVYCSVKENMWESSVLEPFSFPFVYYQVFFMLVHSPSCPIKLEGLLFALTIQPT